MVTEVVQTGQHWRKMDSWFLSELKFIVEQKETSMNSQNKQTDKQKSNQDKQTYNSLLKQWLRSCKT